MNDLSELLKECAPLAEAKRPNYEILAKARELKDLGFDRLASDMRDAFLLTEKLECIKKEGYLIITEKAIQAFLERKAAEYNESVVKKHGPKESLQDSLHHTILNMKRLQELSNWRFDGSETAPASDWDRNERSFWDRDEDPVSPAPWARTGDLVAITNDFLSPAKERVSGFIWNEEKLADYKAIPPDHALAALKSARAKEIFDYFTIASVSHVKDPLLLGRLNGSTDRYFLAQWGDDIALDDVI